MSLLSTPITVPTLADGVYPAKVRNFYEPEHGRWVMANARSASGKDLSMCLNLGNSNPQAVDISRKQAADLIRACGLPEGSALGDIPEGAEFSAVVRDGEWRYSRPAAFEPIVLTFVPDEVQLAELVRATPEGDAPF